MSQNTRKSRNISYKLRASEKMAPKPKRSKKARTADAAAADAAMPPPAPNSATTTTTTATPPKSLLNNSAASVPIEIKKERTDDENVVELIDIKPDIHVLNKELFDEVNSAVLHPQSTLPRLFIISQLPSSCVTNVNAAAAVTPATVGNVSLHGFTAIAAPHLASDGVPSGSGSGANAAPTKLFDDVLSRDEFDFQESDSDEDGYSDIDFNDDDDLIEADDEDDSYAPQWTDQPTAPRMVCNFDTLPVNVGLHGRPTCLEPSFYIEKMLLNQQEFFKKIASSTNARAQMQMGANRGSQIYLKDITSDEMKVFIGICLQMSTMKLRTIADYWNKQAVWGFEGFGSKMSLTRFQMIMSALSFDHLMVPSSEDELESWAPANGPADISNVDPAFSSVQPLVDFFNARMEEIYNCGQRLVLNDPIILWKGKFSWFSDLSAKFRCNSVLLHLLTEYNGLIQRLVLDVERMDRRVNVRNSKFLIAQRVGVAMHLLNTRLGKGHTIYASKFYGSYALAHQLAAHQTYCTGFVDVKRFGNCKELILNTLEPKTFATKYAGSIMMGKWRNRQKNEYFFSSDCLAIYAKETSMRTLDRRPKIIKELNWQLHWKLSEEMKEKMVYYQLCLERNELKWDKQLAIYVLNLMLFNAYVLYILHAQLGRTRFTELHLRDTTILKSYSEFREEFIQSLLSDHTESKIKDLKEERETKKKRRSTSAAAVSEEEDAKDDQQLKDEAPTHRNLLEMEHLPMIIPRRKGKVMKKKCRICHKRGLLTFSKLCCEVCPGMPGLCETPCFGVWHDHLKRSLEAGVKVKTRVFGSGAMETIYF